MNEPWREVGDRVFVRRHESLDLNVGLIVGDTACLILDTRLSHRQGRDVAEAVRTVTPLPWIVANTHGHYDHSFGNAVFAPADIWGHERCVTMLETHGEIKRAYFAAHADAALAAELDEVVITPPNRVFTAEQRLDLGGREIILRHVGRGHTDNDILLLVPDAAVLFAGDLVEEGMPPVFGDAFPLDWPATLTAVAALSTGAVVPGHGGVVDRAFVLDQTTLLTRTADAARAVFAANRPAEDAVADVPLPPKTALIALRRAYRQLRGDPPNVSPTELRQSLEDRSTGPGKA